MRTLIAPWMILATIYALYSGLFWPGIMSADSNSQYLAAVSGIYSDHHPPMMSFLWRHLDYILSGSGLIFLFHITLLFAASGICIYIFRNSRFKYLYAIYPLIPNVFSYTPLIVKDVGFTYTYLVAGALIALMITSGTKQHDKKMILVALLLFYGTAVKFQAKFLLIIFSIGLAYATTNFKKFWVIIAMGSCFSIVLFLAVFEFNYFMVPNAKQQHTWQLVKLYDLAAMSIEKNQQLFPEFVKTNPNYNFEKVKELFNESEVDSLVFSEDNVLNKGDSSIERQELKSYWQSVVVNNLGLYIKIRYKLWRHNFTSIPAGRSDVISYFKQTAIEPIVSNQSVRPYIEITYDLLRELLKFQWLFPISIIYLIIGIKKIEDNSYAKILLMFNSAALTLVGLLFLFSMAATSRYVFFSVCMIHISHGFAYKALISR